MTNDTDKSISTRIEGGGSLRGIPELGEISLAVNAFLMADKMAREGNERASNEKKQHLDIIQGRYWRLLYSVLSSALSRRRQTLDFSDEERLFLDLGLVDPRMLGDDRTRLTGELLTEINSKGMQGCYYLSEWLTYRHQQSQLESAIAGENESGEGQASQIGEFRKRIFTRLAEYFVGLPGVPLEVSESMRSGELDSAVIASGIAAMANPRRRNFLRRRNLWLLREQVLGKARARVSSQAVLRLFDMLNEVYTRDWRERYEKFLVTGREEKAKTSSITTNEINTVSASTVTSDIMMTEIRQIRMRVVLMDAIDGRERAEPILNPDMPRINKDSLDAFLAIPRTFDRSMTEPPPILLVPEAGRGFFSWENACVILALRPLVGLDDSVATAFARMRMMDDRLNRGGELRRAYERKFPGAVFQNDFPADYRTWLCRLPKGDINAMPQERRNFFREHIGPDLTGPLLPPNLRNVGPMTMGAICRRLEKQLASGDDDANLHRRLAAIYWQQGNVEAAGVQFTAAMRRDPDDGEALFSAGMFMRSQGDGEAANECFRYGAERAAKSMWGVYCRDALAGLL